MASSRYRIWPEPGNDSQRLLERVGRCIFRQVKHFARSGVQGANNAELSPSKGITCRGRRCGR